MNFLPVLLGRQTGAQEKAGRDHNPAAFTAWLYHNGIRRRLTDVHGELISQLLA